jgi:hypothetical protein
MWMKVFVQNKKTDLFLTDDGNWISCREQARDFKRAIGALEFCIQKKEHDVWILLAFENEALNVQLDPFKNAAEFRNKAMS